MKSVLEFKPVIKESMAEIMPYLQLEKERTCDFSYGGVLMWAPLYNYCYTINNNTLFMRGNHPDDASVATFTFPLGSLPLEQAVQLLKDYCEENDLNLIFSAVPEMAKDRLMEIGAKSALLQPKYGDYIYDAQMLAYLKGKKMSKKRNHVNQFINNYPDWKFEPLHVSHIPRIRETISKDINQEAAQTEEARLERELASRYLDDFEEGNHQMAGGVLIVGDKIVAYTIGDIKDDTLYVHIEKGERCVAGSFEMINKQFAQYVLSLHPEVKYINREDDAGDDGLKAAKQSYHPLKILEKYQVAF